MRYFYFIEKITNGMHKDNTLINAKKESVLLIIIQLRNINIIKLLSILSTSFMICKIGILLGQNVVHVFSLKCFVLTCIHDNLCLNKQNYACNTCLEKQNLQT